MSKNRYVTMDTNEKDYNNTWGQIIQTVDRKFTMDFEIKMNNKIVLIVSGKSKDKSN
jgi:hypothetical protein